MKFEMIFGSKYAFKIGDDRALTAYRSGDCQKTLYSDGSSALLHSNPEWLRGGYILISERRPITDESDLNECIGQQSQDEFIDDFVTFGKYDRQCKGVVIDVYDVLQAFEVVNPALQHLIKKALCAGLRGHKKREQDLVEILESAKRAIELEVGK